jgi:hypothetical protein
MRGSSTYSWMKFDKFAWLQSQVKLLILGNSYVSLYGILKLQISAENRIKIASGYSLDSIKFSKNSWWKLLFVFRISGLNFQKGLCESPDNLLTIKFFRKKSWSTNFHLSSNLKFNHNIYKSSDVTFQTISKIHFLFLSFIYCTIIIIHKPRSLK